MEQGRFKRGIYQVESRGCQNSGTPQDTPAPRNGGDSQGHAPRLAWEKVFTREGKPVKSIREAFDSACKQALIDDFIFHDFSHTAINNWRLQGHDYFRIMSATGHKTIQVFKRYNKVSEEELKNLVQGKK